MKVGWVMNKGRREGGEGKGRPGSPTGRKGMSPVWDEIGGKALTKKSQDHQVRLPEAPGTLQRDQATKWSLPEQLESSKIHPTQILSL